jgi:phage gp36-like protein
MGRFLKDSDYAFKVRSEIKLLLTTDDSSNQKLLQAEITAISQIRNWLSKRYNCDAIFIDAPDDGQTDQRNAYMVECVIVIALYKLYSQTQMKDIPEHRKQEYQDVLDWLKDAGSGKINTDLPPLSEETFKSEVRIWSDKERKNQDW